MVVIRHVVCLHRNGNLHPMDSLRRRVPFKLAEDDNDNDSDIYDEQRVSNHLVVGAYDLIICIITRTRIRDSGTAARGEYLQQKGIAFSKNYRWPFFCYVRYLLQLSPLLHLIVSFSSQLGFNNLRNNRAILSSRTSIPLRIIISASSFLIHYHLAVILSKQFRDYFYPFSDPTPVSYRFIYSVSLLAPAISLYFEIPWEIAIWWSYTPLLVFAIHRVMNSIEDVNRGIVNLEALKYKAPGA